jgi:hypothetical protein
MHLLFSVYELTASTCFEHYLIVFRGRCINKIGILCVYYVGWLLLGLECNSNPSSSEKISRSVNEERDILRAIKGRLNRLVTSCGGTAL